MNTPSRILTFFFAAIVCYSCDIVHDPQWIAMEQLDTLIVPGVHGKLKTSEPVNSYTMPQFHREWLSPAVITEAKVKICGLGHFELYVNGVKASDHFLDPGWTDYSKEAQYVELDVTDLVRRGKNCIDIYLGNGFYNIPNERYTKLVGSYGQPKLIMELSLTYPGGLHQEIVSNLRKWKVAPSPITFSSIYGGESYDARLEDKHVWQKPVKVPTDILLKPQEKGTEVTVRDTIPAAGHFPGGKGGWIYDFGQNFSGIVRLGVTGSEGAEVQLWPSELLKDGDVDQRPSGSPYHWDYTLKGGGSTEVWQPRFTFYGQRFVKVVGAVPKGEANPEGLPEIVELTGLHTCVNADEAGSFECGEELFNRTHELIDWAIRSNSQSVFTDCPHREKLGWLEEAYLMQNSIQYRYNVHPLYRKVLSDMETAQWANGCIPSIAPMYVLFNGGFEDSPEWGSAFIISPWQAYRWYGDVNLISDHYPAMKRYIEYLGSRAEGNIIEYGLGDWFDIGPGVHGVSQLTGKGLTATAIYYYDVTLMAKMAALLGLEEDERYFTALASAIKDSFNRRFYNEEGGYYDRNSQTANAMPLYVGLVEEENRERVLGSLIDGIRKNNWALTAGDIGFRFLVQTLQDAGRSDVIYKMNCRSDVPGYGWQLAHGATALTESWQAYTGISNNHLMLGHLMEWFYGGLCGIRQTEESVAFKHLLIAPQIVPEVGRATASLDIEGGKVRSSWKILEDGSLFVEVSIPEGSDAHVCVPEYGIDSYTGPGTFSFSGRINF